MELQHIVEIVLVEDNPSDAELAVMILKGKDLAGKLVHLKDGAEALDFVFADGPYKSRSIEDTPRLMLLDINLPKVSGLEVLARIRADERTKKIPVVILTSSKEDRDIAESYRLGVNSYIVKPVEFEKFREVLEQTGIYWLRVNQPPV